MHQLSVIKKTRHRPRLCYVRAVGEGKLEPGSMLGGNKHIHVEQREVSRCLWISTAIGAAGVEPVAPAKD